MKKKTENNEGNRSEAQRERLILNRKKDACLSKVPLALGAATAAPPRGEANNELRYVRPRNDRFTATGGKYFDLFSSNPAMKTNHESSHAHNCFSTAAVVEVNSFVCLSRSTFSNDYLLCFTGYYSLAVQSIIEMHLVYGLQSKCAE